MDWISVKDRLPEEMTMILLFYDDETVIGYLKIEKAYTTGRKHIVNHPERKMFVMSQFDDWCLEKEVNEKFYWMPLPQPPKE